MGWLALLPLLFLLTLAWVFYPLLTRPRLAPAQDAAAPLHLRRDLLLREIKELDYESEIGLIAPEEAAQARDQLLDEAARALARMERETPAPAATPAPVENRGLTLFALIFIVLILAIGSGGLYVALGTPVPPPPPAAAPRDHAMEGMVQALAERMKQDPNNLEGWLQLGRSYAYLNRPIQAMEAFSEVLKRDANNLDAAVGLAEAQLGTGNPQYVSMGFALFEEILKNAPDRMEALWYGGQGALQAGDAKTALERFRKVLTMVPVGSEFQITVQKAIAKAEKQIQ